ncbi:MAG: hypothetical protein U0003_05180, partial [Vampirovibrionales bacterium]
DTLGDVDVAYGELDRMVKKRFHDTSKDRLPLEDYNSGSKLLEWLPLPLGKAFFKLQHQASTPPQSLTQALGNSVAQGFLPFSVRHPNQPLWILE